MADTHLSTQIGNNSNITKSSVIQLHAAQLLNGGNNKNKALNFIEAFGGIDIVFKTCVESMGTLTDRQLQQIHQILSVSGKDKPDSKDLSQIKDQSGAEDHESFGYTFDRKNAFIYSLFQNKKANKIIDIVYHKF
eukprot:456671_1